MNLLDHLRSHDQRVAVLTHTEQLTYRDLADRVADAAQDIGAERRLVLLETRNDLTTLVHYLAGMAGGHVLLPVPAGRDHTTMVQTYHPGVMIDADGVHHRHRGDYQLHDDLALLLSTSGSTGSPKMVRLSHTNLVANAAAIAEYLEYSRNRPGRNNLADIVLLRPVGDPQPPAVRGQASSSPITR